MPRPNEITWGQIKHVDHDKAWKVLLRTDRQGLLTILARALRSVPLGKLESIFSDYAHPHEIGGVHGQELRPLLEAVREFAEAALRGEFYEDFIVNSHNSTDKSAKTEVFEAQLDLLLDRCVADALTGDPSEICAAYDLLFDLLREIDKFELDIVFFGDEGGVWQFGINWQRALPPYIHCLAKTIEPDKFERRAEAIIEEFVDAWQRGALRLLLSGLMKTNTGPTVFR